MGERDAEVGLGTFCVALLRGGEVVKCLGVGTAMQIDEPTIDIAIGIARLHDVCVRCVQRCIGAVGLPCAVADDDDLLSVVLAGDCPDAVQVCPAREPSVDIGAVCADEVIARVDDWFRWTLFAAVCEEVLDVGACARTDVGEGEPLRAVSGGTKPAEIILSPVNIAAVCKEACFLERLCECEIGTHTLVLRLLVVGVDELLGRTRELRFWVAAQEVGEHLLLGCRCLSCDCDRGKRGNGQWKDVGICSRRDKRKCCGELCIYCHMLRYGGGKWRTRDGHGCFCSSCE